MDDRHGEPRCGHRNGGVADGDALHAYRNPTRVFDLDDLTMLIGLTNPRRCWRAFLEEYQLERAVIDRARSERQIADAVIAARSKGLPWQRLGALLGTSAQAAQQRYGAVVGSA